MDPKIIATLIGIFVGFGLSESTQLLKTMYRKRRLRKALVLEVDAILRLIPLRKFALTNDVEAYKGGGVVMPSTIIQFPNSAYKKLLDSEPDTLKSIERDCLHAAYEILRIIDSRTEGIMSLFNSMTSIHTKEHGTKAAVSQLSMFAKSLDNSSMFLESFLKGTSVNPYLEK
jgi:hypothetical protein